MTGNSIEEQENQEPTKFFTEEEWFAADEAVMEIRHSLRNLFPILSEGIQRELFYKTIYDPETYSRETFQQWREEKENYSPPTESPKTNNLLMRKVYYDHLNNLIKYLPKNVISFSLDGVTVKRTDYEKAIPTELLGENGSEGIKVFNQSIKMGEGAEVFEETSVRGDDYTKKENWECSDLLRYLGHLILSKMYKDLDIKYYQKTTCQTSRRWYVWGTNRTS